MNLDYEVREIINQGYRQIDARSKLCQDIVLKAIADSGMADHATIKGGVVMRNLSGDCRRATQDFDLDFIRYSISDDSIRKFVRKLDCVDGLHIELEGPIQMLRHQDYQGRRIRIAIADDFGNRLTMKMDIGVHADLSIQQAEYAFELGFQNNDVTLLINSPEQMVTEKIKSLLRIGPASTRYKDMFDIYYLRQYVYMSELRDCVEKQILRDRSLSRINTFEDVVSGLELVVNDKDYVNSLEQSNGNWLGISVRDVIRENLSFLSHLPEKNQSRDSHDLEL